MGDATSTEHATLRGIHHLGLAVDDLEAAASFYKDSFGAEVGEPETVEDQGIIAMMLTVGDSRLELLQPTAPDTPVGRFLARRGPGVHHVAYAVDDVGVVLRGLAGDGAELVDEQPRVGAGGARVAFAHHPSNAFGVLTELVEAPKADR